MKMIPACLLIVSSVGIVACTDAGEDTSTEEHIGSASLAWERPGDNGLDSYKVVHASIIVNPPDVSALLNNPLRTEKLTSDLKSTLCGDGTSMEAFGYIVKCALPDTASVTVTCSGTPHIFNGRYGLADGRLGTDDAWGSSTGSCNSAYCQQWVSACVMVHSNFQGQNNLSIQLGGNHPAFNVAGATQVNVHEEGAYFGNVFNRGSAGNSVRYGCRGVNADYVPPNKNLPLLARTCGGYNSTTHTRCDACDLTQYNEAQGRCTTRMDYFDNLTGPDGAVQRCKDLCGTDSATNGEFYSNCGPSGPTGNYTSVITVWRP